MTKTTDEFIKGVKENYLFRSEKIKGAIEGKHAINLDQFNSSRREDEVLIKTLMFEHVHQKHAISRELEIGKEVKQIEKKKKSYE